MEPLVLAVGAGEVPEASVCAVDALCAVWGKSQPVRDKIIRWLKRQENIAVSKKMRNNRWVNVALVSAAELERLKAEYGESQPAKSPSGAGPSPSGVKRPSPVEEAYQKFDVATKALSDSIEREMEEKYSVAAPVDVLDVLKKLGFPKEWAPQVGATATRLFKRKWPGRQLGKRPRVRTTSSGNITFEENAWSVDELPLLKLCAMWVYKNKQPALASAAD